MTTFFVGSRRARATQDERKSRSRKVKTQRPIMMEEEHSVLQFRPRNSAHSPVRQRNIPVQPRRPEGPPAEFLALSRYERPRQEPDDFRQRMLGNIAGFAFTIALMAIGIWLVMSIADLRRTPDCVQISTP